jgi:hypothetical protein
MDNQMAGHCAVAITPAALNPETARAPSTATNARLVFGRHGGLCRFSAFIVNGVLELFL